MRSPLDDYLANLVDEMRKDTSGTLYSVTESVEDPNPNDMAISLTTVDGQLYSAGDTEQSFAIQSIAKIIAYGVALEDYGANWVGERIDVEPSGDPFNEISLQRDTGRPDNAMINAGAIATVGLLKGRGGRDRIGRILRANSMAAAGSPGDLTVSDAVVRVEDRLGHRNKALAWLLRSFDIIDSDPEEILQDYYRQCAIKITTKNLSMMAATMANRGVNPITGDEVFSPETTRQVLAVMNTCGMYDDAGSWAIDVGLPAKSGVGGGLLVVVPGQLGVGIYSPPLDEHGNSVRANLAMRRLTRDLGLSMVDAPPLGRSVLRAQYSLADASTGVVRSTELLETVEEYGENVQIIDVNGDLGFVETETLTRTVVEMDEAVSIVIMDLTGVDQFGKSAIRFLAELADRMVEDDRDIVIIHEETRLVEHMLAFARTQRDMDLEDPREDAKAASLGQLMFTTEVWHAPGSIAGEFRLFETRTHALEWAELRLAQRYSDYSLPEEGQEQLDDSPLFSFLDESDVEVIWAFMEERTFKPGQVIRRMGQPFGGIYFIESGRVEITAQGTGGTKYRQAYLSPGMTFGEVALGRTGRQLSTVRALDDVTVSVLTAQMISSLEETDPQLAIKLWTALTREAYTVLEQTSREAGARDE